MLFEFGRVKSQKRPIETRLKTLFSLHGTRRQQPLAPKLMSVADCERSRMKKKKKKTERRKSFLLCDAE